MKYQVEKTSRLGNRAANEDHIGVAESNNAILLVLADGMGGYRGGQLASKTLVNNILSQFKGANFPLQDPKIYLKELIANAHLAVIRAGNEQHPPIQPRTTCVVCLIQEACAWWAHVGDSRLYLYRQGELITRTTDHSQIEELHRRGTISRQEMEKHPQRHLVTRCIGFQELPPIPTISDKMPLEKNDLLLLCSDGLWAPLNEKMITEALFKAPLAEAVDKLAYEAESRSYPEADNISLIALRLISVDAAKEDMSKPEGDELLKTLDALNQAMGKFNKP